MTIKAAVARNRGSKIEVVLLMELGEGEIMIDTINALDLEHQLNKNLCFQEISSNFCRILNSCGVLYTS